MGPNAPIAGGEVLFRPDPLPRRWPFMTLSPRAESHFNGRRKGVPGPRIIAQPRMRRTTSPDRPMEVHNIGTAGGPARKGAENAAVVRV